MVMENSGNPANQPDGNTSFLRAARSGNYEKVLEFINNNADINAANSNGLNALHLASKDGHINVVKELLSRGAKVDSATKKGNTSLHIASLAGQEEVVKLLLEYGACVNVQSQSGFTPLYMAAQENHDTVVKLLLMNGANQALSTEDGFTPLAVAMQQGHDKVVAELLENDTRGKIRLPALHIAAKKDDCKAAALLLQNEHNPDITSKSGFTPLHIASHYGNEAVASLLLARGADVNYTAKHCITPLHVAAKWGRNNMVNLLLDKGATIDSKTRDGLTPLHCAARSGHEQVVETLLLRDAPLSAKTKNGLAPLHMAAQGDHVEAARVLLLHRAPVDDVTVDYLTALHVAAHCGHALVAKLLLDRKAEPNARALNGFTPLHIACKKNRMKIVELLLKYGGSIEATTESGLSALHVASFMGCMNIVVFLLQCDANPDVCTIRGETPLHLAARSGQTDIIRILLRNGAQVNATARENQTALHIASRIGNVDIVMLLIQHGCLVDATTKDLYTPLHTASKEGQQEVAQVLLEHNAAVCATTKKGFTPLHLAAKYGRMKVARLLIQRDANLNAQGKKGVTPLHVASHYDHQNIALLLLDKGASPHTTAKNGHTALHIAAKKAQMDIASTLLEYGASAKAESKAGFTPLHLSAQEGHTDMSNLLIDHRADVNHKSKNGLTPIHLCAQEDKVTVAQVLVRNSADVNVTTKGGYTPLHIASHFGQLNMVRFLLANNADVKAVTSSGNTALHQAAQQGNSTIVALLIEHGCPPDSKNNHEQTALHISQKLGYISVVETLKKVTTQCEPIDDVDGKYNVVAPEIMQENFMSDSEDEAGEDTLTNEQSYRYLTVDEMKSLGDDSLPIDMMRDDRFDTTAVSMSIMEDTMTPHHVSNLSNAPAPDNIDVKKHSLAHAGFLVSFLVDARGGAMRGCRHSGVRVIVPPQCASMPTRVTCRYLRRDRLVHPPPLMEGEALASRILELGPVGAKFLGPVMIEVPHFASVRGNEREIIILRSENGDTWREHTFEAGEQVVQEMRKHNADMEEESALEDTGRITSIITNNFPHYFAIISRVRQEVHAVGPEGGMVSSTVVPQVQAVFPQGALTKKIKVGLQAQAIPSEITANILGNCVAVSPIVTIEPRRRKFHKPITLTLPVPQAANKGMINQYSGEAPTLRLLCSITGGATKAQWEDVTGSTPLTFVKECVSFTTTVSARFWLMDIRDIATATKKATELYREITHVPFMAKFVVFAKKIDNNETKLRVFCMTDDKEDKTLEFQEHFIEVAKSRDVEVLEGKNQLIDLSGNLVSVTKTGDQLKLGFNAFQENRLPFTVRVKDPLIDPIGRMIFYKEQKQPTNTARSQNPVCVLNIMLPTTVAADSEFVDMPVNKYSFLRDIQNYNQPELRLADISNLIGDDWLPLAKELGVCNSSINIIKSECPENTANQAITMLRIWSQQTGNQASSSTLASALVNIGREDILNECKLYTNENENNTTKSQDKIDSQEHTKKHHDETKYIAEEKNIEPLEIKSIYGVDNASSNDKSRLKAKKMVSQEAKLLSEDESTPEKEELTNKKLLQSERTFQEISAFKNNDEKVDVGNEKTIDAINEIKATEVFLEREKELDSPVIDECSLTFEEKRLSFEHGVSPKLLALSKTEIISDVHIDAPRVDVTEQKSDEMRRNSELFEGITHRLENLGNAEPEIVKKGYLSLEPLKTPPSSPAEFPIVHQQPPIEKFHVETESTVGNELHEENQENRIIIDSTTHDTESKPSTELPLDVDNHKKDDVIKCSNANDVEIISKSLENEATTSTECENKDINIDEAEKDKILLAEKVIQSELITTLEGEIDFIPESIEDNRTSALYETIQLDEPINITESMVDMLIEEETAKLVASGNVTFDYSDSSDSDNEEIYLNKSHSYTPTSDKYSLSEESNGIIVDQAENGTSEDVHDSDNKLTSKGVIIESSITSIIEPNLDNAHLDEINEEITLDNSHSDDLHEQPTLPESTYDISASSQELYPVTSSDSNNQKPTSALKLAEKQYSSTEYSDDEMEYVVNEPSEEGNHRKVAFRLDSEEGKIVFPGETDDDEYSSEGDSSDNNESENENENDNDTNQINKVIETVDYDLNTNVIEEPNILTSDVNKILEEKCVDNKFNEIASEALGENLNDKASAEGEFRKIVSQLSREEVDECAAIWNETNKFFSESKPEDIFLKNNESQYHVSKLLNYEYEIKDEKECSNLLTTEEGQSIPDKLSESNLNSQQTIPSMPDSKDIPSDVESMDYVSKRKFWQSLSNSSTEAPVPKARASISVVQSANKDPIIPPVAKRRLSMEGKVGDVSVSLDELSNSTNKPKIILKDFHSLTKDSCDSEKEYIEICGREKLSYENTAFSEEEEENKEQEPINVTPYGEMVCERSSSITQDYITEFLEGGVKAKRLLFERKSRSDSSDKDDNIVDNTQQENLIIAKDEPCEKKEQTSSSRRASFIDRNKHFSKKSQDILSEDATEFLLYKQENAAQSDSLEVLIDRSESDQSCRERNFTSESDSLPDQMSSFSNEYNKQKDAEEVELDNDAFLQESRPNDHQTEGPNDTNVLCKNDTIGSTKTSPVCKADVCVVNTQWEQTVETTGSNDEKYEKSYPMDLTLNERPIGQAASSDKTQYYADILNYSKEEPVNVPDGKSPENLLSPDLLHDLEKTCERYDNRERTYSSSSTEITDEDLRSTGAESDFSLPEDNSIPFDDIIEKPGLQYSTDDESPIDGNLDGGFDHHIQCSPTPVYPYEKCSVSDQHYEPIPLEVIHEEQLSDSGGLSDEDKVFEYPVRSCYKRSGETNVAICSPTNTGTIATRNIQMSDVLKLNYDEQEIGPDDKDLIIPQESDKLSSSEFDLKKADTSEEIEHSEQTEKSSESHSISKTLKDTNESHLEQEVAILRSPLSDGDESSQMAIPLKKHDTKAGTDFEVNSSSSESHYQSFEPSSGSRSNSRPCSSDVEGLLDAKRPSGGHSSEYESATSYDTPAQSNYHTALESDSHESMKSIDSDYSATLASEEISSEISETLVPSCSELDRDFEFQSSYTNDDIAPLRDVTESDIPGVFDKKDNVTTNYSVVDNSENLTIRHGDQKETKIPPVKKPRRILSGDSSHHAKPHKTTFDDVQDTRKPFKEPYDNEIPMHVIRARGIFYPPGPNGKKSGFSSYEDFEFDFSIPASMDETCEERLSSSEDVTQTSLSISSPSNVQTALHIQKSDSDKFEHSLSLSGTSELSTASDLKDELASDYVVAKIDVQTATEHQKHEGSFESVTLTTSSIEENGIYSVATQITSEAKGTSFQNEIQSTIDGKIREETSGESCKQYEEKVSNVVSNSSDMSEERVLKIEQEGEGSPKKHTKYNARDVIMSSSEGSLGDDLVNVSALEIKYSSIFSTTIEDENDLQSMLSDNNGEENFSSPLDTTIQVPNITVTEHNNLELEDQCSAKPDLLHDLKEISTATSCDQTDGTKHKECEVSASEKVDTLDDSFELIEKPNLIDDFVVVEEVGKEANEQDSEGRCIQIVSNNNNATKTIVKPVRKHRNEKEELDLMPIKIQNSDNSDAICTFPIVDISENKEDNTKMSQSTESVTDDKYAPDLEEGKKWVAMQFQSEAESSTPYEYDLEYERAALEDIKEEDTDDLQSSKFGSVGSQVSHSVGSLGSVKLSLGSTPDYDTLAGKRYFSRSGERDDISMNSLQEFEKLEQLMALECVKGKLQGSPEIDATFAKKHEINKVNNVSASSLKEFESIESAFIETEKLVEIAKDEEESLSESKKTHSKNTSTGIHPSPDSDNDSYEKKMFEIDEIIRQAQSNVEKFTNVDNNDDAQSLGRGDSIEEVSRIPDFELDEPVVTSEREDLKAPGTSRNDKTTTDFTRPYQDKSVSDLLSTSTDSLSICKTKNTIITDSFSSTTTGFDFSDSKTVTSLDDETHPNEDSGVLENSSSDKDDLNTRSGGLGDSTDSLDGMSSVGAHDMNHHGSLTSSSRTSTTLSNEAVNQAVENYTNWLNVGNECTETVELSKEEGFSHIVHQNIQLPAEIHKVTFQGPEAKEELEKYVQNFQPGNDICETEEIDSEGNVHVKQVIQRRIVLLPEDIGKEKSDISREDVDNYVKNLSQVVTTTSGGDINIASTKINPNESSIKQSSSHLSKIPTPILLSSSSEKYVSQEVETSRSEDNEAEKEETTAGDLKGKEISEKPATGEKPEK